MGTAKFDDYTHILPPIKLALIKGGSAGNHTLTGITTDDKILSVWSGEFDTDGTISTVADLTSEFDIDSAGVIDNTGGTGTTDALLQVLWADYDL